MEFQTLRLLIKHKLADRQLPHGGITRTWAGPGNGEMCDVCEGIISKQQCVVEGIAKGGMAIQFHAECFYLWVALRSAPAQ